MSTTLPWAAPTLAWSVESVDAEPSSAVPALRFRTRIVNAGAEPVRSLVLSVSVSIAAALREYTAEDRPRLRGVFGTPDQWADSVGDIVWARPTVMVPGFTDSTAVDVPVPCGQDLDLASASYLHALTEGDVPLRFAFTGTVFFARDGALSAAQLPWDSEARYRMPAAVWHDLRRRYFGGSRWLRLDADTFDALQAHRVRHAHASVQDAVRALLTSPGSTP